MTKLNDLILAQLPEKKPILSARDKEIREMIEKERKRFILIFDQRNSKLHSIGAQPEASYEHFDFNVFAENILASLKTKQEEKA